MTRLYLIRHGESVANVEPIIGGMRGDAGLTRRGVKQAELLRDRLAATGEIPADVLIGSTLPRARQTTEIIAPALGLKPIWDDEAQELRPGVADGMSVDEFRRTFGTPDTARDPFRPMSPEGESWPAFMLRVGAAIDRITREHAGKTVVIVSHGGFIDGSFVYFFGVDTLRRAPVAFLTHNTAITQWEQGVDGDDGDDGDARWRLVRYNDVAHLRDVGVEPPAEWRGTGADQPAVPVPSEKMEDRDHF